MLLLHQRHALAAPAGTSKQRVFHTSESNNDTKLCSYSVTIVNRYKSTAPGCSNVEANNPSSPI